MEYTTTANPTSVKKESIRDMTKETSEILKSMGARLRDIAIFLDKACQAIEPMDTLEIGSFGDEIRANLLTADRMRFYVNTIGETLGVVFQDLPR